MAFVIYTEHVAGRLGEVNKDDVMDEVMRGNNCILERASSQ